MVVLYALYFSVRTVGVHNGLGTSAYDFGLYDQGIWLMSRGHSPFVTLMGRNLFGDHSSFVLVLLIPLYWIFSSTSLLFVVQSIVVAIGALPVYWFSRQRLRSEPLAAAMAGVYLLHPSIGWTNLENFHPDAALGTLVAVAIWAAYAGKWRWYWVAVVLALSVKEDVAFVLAPLGIWVALKADKKRGLITSLASLATMALMFLVVMRGFTGVSFRNSWRIPFGGLGGLLGGLAAGGAAGGIGALLTGSQGFGAKLNSSLTNQGEPDVEPSASQEALAGLMVLAMVQAAKSDGEIDAVEQEKVLGNLGDVSPQEAAFVNAALEAPLDVEALAAQVPEGLEAQVYTMSLMAIDLDNQQEANYLHALAQALGLDQSEVNHIHAELGAPALYA